MPECHSTLADVNTQTIPKVHSALQSSVTCSETGCHSYLWCGEHIIICQAVVQSKSPILEFPRITLNWFKLFPGSRQTLLSWSPWLIHLLESSSSCQLCALCGTSSPRKSMIPREQERRFWTIGVHQRSCWETWTFLITLKNMTKTIFRWVIHVFIS